MAEDGIEEGGLERFTGPFFDFGGFDSEILEWSENLERKGKGRRAAWGAWSMAWQAGSNVIWRNLFTDIS